MSMEKISKEMERSEAAASLLEHFDAKFIDKQEITREDVAEMKDRGITVEKFLGFIGKNYGYLFHGSRMEIPFTDTLQTSGGKVFASSNPAIAIMKAIYLNNAKNLGYPLHVDEDNANLALQIDGPQVNTIGELGYVYVVSAEGFIPDPNSNWQYSRADSASFVKRVQIGRDDFKYPVRVT